MDDIATPKPDPEVIRAQNEGRALARSATIEWLEEQIRRAKASQHFRPAETEGFVQGLEDALRLVRLTDPLQVWEVDIRNGRTQWGDRSPHNTLVVLNGELVPRIQAADSVRGLALQIVEDPDTGRPALGTDRKPILRVLSGQVELRNAR